MLNALTVDFEEWYQALPSASAAWRSGHSFESRIWIGAERLLAILDETNVRATFFVVGRLAEAEPALIRSIAGAGHEIAVHGYDHAMLSGMSAREIKEDLKRSKDAVETAANVLAAGYRAPCFSMPRNHGPVFEMLASFGFAYDSSVFPVRTPLYGLKGAPSHPYRCNGILEVPVPVLRVCGVCVPFSGGAYLRLLPTPLIAGAFRRLNAQGHAVVSYVHPWEFDPDHPREPANRLEAITHYSNLQGTAERLRRLLGEFRFAPVRAAFNVGV